MTICLRGRDTGFYGDGTNNTHVPKDSTVSALVNNTYPYDYGNKRTEDYGNCIYHSNATSTYTTEDGSNCYWCSACGQSATGPFGTYRYIDSGYCGDNLYWSLDSDGCLWIDGSGDMWDNKVVWFPYRNCVLSINMSDSISSIGSLAFDNADYLQTVYLPTDLIRIGESAFRGCDSLKRILIYGDLNQIEEGAFYNCNALTDVYYVGTPAQWNSINIGNYNDNLNNANRHYACTIAFDANSGTGEMETIYSFTGFQETISSNEFSRNGFVFTGWNTKADGTGTAYADGATLTITNSLTLYAQWVDNFAITTQPTNKAVNAGSAATFKVVATGATSYQWQVSTDNGKTWVNSGANGNKTATLSFTAAQAHNNYQFRCVVSGSSGQSVTSSAATLTVTAAGPAITTQPKSATVSAGSTATFIVAATGATSYQWQASTNGGKTWVNSGAGGNKTATLSFTAAAAHNGYMFRCVVTGTSGQTVTSNAATLMINGSAPTITTQPANKAVNAGSAATFKVVATGATSYQWQVSTDNGKTWVNSGANGNKTATLSFTAAQAHNNYQFRCVVSGSSGQSVTSSAATLTINDNSTLLYFPFYLYSNDGKVYLGKLVTDEYDQDGIWNEYGTYGSKYSSNSIWNEYGTYGSEYSNESAFNELATKPPMIVDYYGSFVGYLTTNTSIADGYSITTIRHFLINNNQ